MPKPYTPNDRWSQLAAREGYRARSAYKLMELDERFRLIKPGMTIIDLGAAPGSWLQVAAEKIGSNGRVIGVDLQPIEHITDNVTTIQHDITDANGLAETIKKYDITQCDLILSDLAPNTSGVKDVDQWRSIELSQAVIAIAEKLLKPKGVCVFKILRGADFDAFLGELKRTWKNIKIVKVKASRDRSREVYVVIS